MKVSENIIVAALIVLALTISCQKSTTEPEPEPQRQKSIPERLEAEFVNIAGRGWGELGDTLQYFRTNLLDKGKLKGYGPDSVYYELKFSREDGLLPSCMDFIIEDSVHLTANGSFKPVSLSIYACGTLLQAQLVGTDSLSLDAGDIGATLPFSFVSDSLSSAPLRFEGVRVGWLTTDEYEDEAYDTSRCLVLHYDNDSRTFAFNVGSLFKVGNLFTLFE